MKSFLILLICSVVFVACGEAESSSNVPIEDEDPTMVGSFPAGSGGKTDTSQVAPGVYTSGIRTQSFELAAMPDEWGKQRMSQWCWAATLQMVLNYHGVAIAQEDIVLRAYGGFINRPAHGVGEIAQSVTGWQFSDRQQVPWLVEAVAVEQINVTSLLQDLHFNQPVVLALQNEQDAGGHAYVLSAITYKVDARGRVFPLSVSLRDPWPEKPAHSVLDWSAFVARFIGYVQLRATPLL